MSRDHERDSVIQFCHNAAEMAVPGVAMNKVRVDVGAIEVDAATKRAENGVQRFRRSEVTRVESEAGDFEASLGEILVAEAANIDIDRFGQLAREISDVDTGAAVNVRRILVREKEDFHASKWIQSRVVRNA